MNPQISVLKDRTTFCIAEQTENLKRVPLAAVRPCAHAAISAVLAVVLHNRPPIEFEWMAVVLSALASPTHRPIYDHPPRRCNAPRPSYVLRAQRNHSP